MSTGAFIPALTKVLEEHMRQLCRLRRITEAEAWEAVRKQCEENYRDSRDTSGEAYWRAALEVADRRVVATADFAGAGAERSD